jgi:hypothetical protein
MRASQVLFAILFVAPNLGKADIVITAGSHEIQPNTPNQLLQVLISTDMNDLVSTMNLRAEIGGGTSGPVFQGPTDDNGFTFTGSIFEGADFTAINSPRPENNRTGEAGAFDSTPVLANGVLGTFIVDTTGISSGTFAFNLINHSTVGFLNSDMGTTPASFLNGSITVIPESSAFLLVALAAMVGSLIGWLRSRRVHWEPQDRAVALPQV